MCGVGAVHGLAAPMDPAVLGDVMKRMRRALAHRGPDGEGQWTSEDGRVGLAHTRLAIVDLETGAQPIANEDGTVRIVVNGEFYDHRRIRRELEARGHRFRTRTDSEVALHLYEEAGPACLERLRGEFALILWDGRERCLFAARDRFGIKPLFFAEEGGRLHLASEAKALFASGVEPAWDGESVYRALFLALSPGRSLFRGVRQLPPGHYLVAGPSSWRAVRYWDADYPPYRRNSVDPARCVEEARDALDEAVRLRLRADVPVGFLLSGGLDSSATLGMARRHLDRPPAAFTIAFDHVAWDESPRARETAERAGAEFHRIRVTEAEAADHFADAVWSGEMVHYNAHGVARYLLARRVREAGYKAVLAGEGGDELFAGYHFCSAAVGSGAASAGPSARLLGRVRSLFSRGPHEDAIAAASPWLARLTRVLTLPKPLLAALAGKLETIDGLVDREYRARAGHDPYRDLYRELSPGAQLRRREPVKQILYLWMKTVFLSYVLAGERLDMAHAVEVRLPLLDHRLFEVVKGIPAAVLAKDGVQKWVLREAARPYVTESVYAAEKHGFLAPPSTLRPGNRLHELIEDTLRSRTLASLPFFDRRAVARILDELPGLDEPARAALDPVVLTIASLCVLQERYGL